MTNSYINSNKEHAELELVMLRLLLSNSASSAYTVIVLVAFLFFTLKTEQTETALAAWSISIIAIKILTTWFTKHLLASDIQTKGVKKHQKNLLILNILDGIAWGALAWICLSNSNHIHNAIVVIVLSAVSNASMSSLSPSLKISWIFGWAIFIPLAIKLFTLADEAYASIIIFGSLYIITLMIQAKNQYASAKSAAMLRFHNLDLVEQLNVEKNHALHLKKVAEDANKAKSTFMASASHDLRQPVHAQGLFLDALATTPLNTMQQDIVVKTKLAGESTVNLLNTLLDYSQIEAGVLKPNIQPVRVIALLRKIEGDLAIEADNKNIVYRTRDTECFVYSDPHLLERILRNLVANAIRYTHAGGVLIATRKKRNTISIEIWDTGIGIAPSEINHVFDEFYQVSNPERDRHKGFGLGLTIAKELAATLAHSLSVNSCLNKGSVFKIEAPSADSQVRHAPTSIQLESISLLNVKILLIDDDITVREAMQALLNSWGCHCSTADNTTEALELCEKSTPDLLICDYRLREQDTGANAIATVRKALKFEVPALLITGDTSPERIREVENSGIPLLHKPVNGEYLKTVLHEILHDEKTPTKHH